MGELHDSGKLDKFYEQAKNATDAAGNKKYTTEQLKQIKANLDKVRGETPQPEKEREEIQILVVTIVISILPEAVFLTIQV